MIRVLAALLLAHILADFTFQTDWIAANKHDDSRAMALHIGTHAIIAGVGLATVTSLPAAALFAALYAEAHLVVDLVKPRPPINVDQTFHLGFIIGLSVLHTIVFRGGVV